MNSRISMQEFENATKNPKLSARQLIAWVNALPYDTPTAFPDGLTNARAPQQVIGNYIRRGKISGAVRTAYVNGVLYVCRQPAPTERGG